MITLDERQLRQTLAWEPLIGAIETLFRKGCEVPVRHHHTIALENQPDATLLLMPAWQAGGFLGVKLVTVYPGNAVRGLPAISGLYVLFSGETGEIIASLDGGELTARRTAAASALASRYLSRQDASVLLVVGTGRMGANLIRAHAAVRPISRVLVWGRSPAGAARVAEDARSDGIAAQAADDIAPAAAEADIISCATLSSEPLIRGEWLREGTHVDLVGAFLPHMRETDDAVMARASRIFVDTIDGAMKEAGDVLQPLESGAITKDAIRGDLFDLTRGQQPGRGGEDEITVFKSVGTALEDLAAAILAYERHRHPAGPLPS